MGIPKERNLELMEISTQIIALRYKGRIYLKSLNSSVRGKGEREEELEESEREKEEEEINGNNLCQQLMLLLLIYRAFSGWHCRG